MASHYPADLRYTDTHEYVRLEGNTATIGITAFAIEQLGDIVFLELPDIGSDVSLGDRFGTVESVKAVEDLKAPVSGQVLEVNTAMVESPENLADDPYGDGWLIKVTVSDASAIEQALSADAYSALVEGT